MPMMTENIGMASSDVGHVGLWFGTCADDEDISLLSSGRHIESCAPIELMNEKTRLQQNGAV